MNVELAPRWREYMDAHLQFCLYASQAERTGDVESRKAALKALCDTDMVDLFEEKKKAWKVSDVSFPRQKKEIVEALYTAGSRCRSLLILLSDDAKLKDLQSKGALNAAGLAAHGVPAEELEHLAPYAFACYKSGAYDTAAKLLSFAVSMTKATLALQWGQLACAIQMGEWDAALDTMRAIRDATRTDTSLSSGKALDSRLWLLHWGLFVFFQHEQGRSTLIEFVLSDAAMLNAVQLSSPWLFRYLAAAVVLHHGKRSTLNDLRSAMKTVRMAYSDPITNFFYQLYADYDFAAAFESLREAKRVCASDPFLHFYSQQFVEQAARLYFETYSRVHSTIALSHVKDLVGTDTDAEAWIMTLVHNARLDATFDASNERVLMNHMGTSIYQQVMDRTKALPHKMSQLVVDTQE